MPKKDASIVQTAMANLQKSKGLTSPLYSASAIGDSWKWIDFVDPKTGGPCLPLEWLFGCRGILCGRVMKIEAFEGVGKSSYCFLQYAMGQQSSNATCIHMESERTPPPADYISAFGTNTDDLYISQPVTLEEALTDATNIMRALGGEKVKGDKSPIIMAIDSISGLSEDDYDEEADVDVGKGSLGKHARMMSKFFRQYIRMIESTNTVFVVTAQLKDKISTERIPTFGSNANQADGKTATIADRPLNFHATYRIKMSSSKLIEDGKDIGETVTFKTVKNKLSPKHRQVSMQLIRDHGVYFTESTINLLKAMSPVVLPRPVATADGTEVSEFALETKGPWLQCPSVLGDKSMKSNKENKDELIRALYANTDLLMGIRESLRIRGFGFDFEKNYRPTDVEVEDNIKPEE